MKKINTKKVIIVASLAVLAVLFVVNNPVMFGFCKSISAWGDGTKYCAHGGNRIEFPEYISQLGVFLSVIFIIFSLITYKMRDEVFRAWWNFARWWVPVIIVTTIMLNNASGTGGGYIGMGKDFTFLILGILYAVLVIVSLVKIVRAYTHSKK